MNFKKLLTAVSTAHDALLGRVAAHANQMLTVRNWIIGYYIVEFEQNGEDRAEYGRKYLKTLVEALRLKGYKGFSERNLYLYREFYISYKNILQTVSAKLSTLPELEEFGGATINFSEKTNGKERKRKLQTASAESSKVPRIDGPAPEVLLSHFTFSHFVELMKITEPFKRLFYEIEAIKGNWSVRQLKRQVESLLFERTGLSRNKSALLKKANNLNDVETAEDMIRDPYILEFTGLPERKEYSENDLETALLDHIQEFLIELGNGFCFEARQKRITIDGEHDRIDLVFYHRILKCHVLIDLKVRRFSHADAGQMNFYLNYYRENVMARGDNPPVGIILCTDRSTTKVKYAVTGLDNKLFVSRYKVALPSEKDLEELIKRDVDRFGMAD